MTTKEDLHDLVDELPEAALTAAEAFLAFLHDRDRPATRTPTTNHSPGRLIGQDWTDNERRGLEQRRQDRDGIPQDPEPDTYA